MDSLPDAKQHDEILDTAIFMVTPGLAHLLGPESDFTASAMAKCFGTHESRGRELRSISGIVDKVVGQAYKGNMKAGSAEGLAYFLTHSKNIAVRQNSTADPAKSVAQLQLQFAYSSFCRINAVEGTWVGDTFLNLPLANTFFINGRSTTLMESMWTTPKAEQEPWQKLNTTELSLLTIHTRRPPRGYIDGGAPLKMMAPWRPIKSALGNVIREVDVDGKTVPASSELESAVETMRKHKTIQSPPLQIFAIVKPAVASVSENSRHLHGHTRSWAGYRYHRVTGGGGGWGNRAGLLSLDPSTSYFDESTTHDQKFGELDMHPPDLTSFTQSKSIFREDDMVSFWAVQPPSPSTLPAEQQPKPTMSVSKYNSADSEYMLFGVIPSEQDLPTEDLSIEQADHITHRRGRFGLLTEKGVAASSEVVLIRPDPSEQQDQQADSPGVATHHESLFEIPNASFFIKLEDDTVSKKPRVQQQPASDTTNDKGESGQGRIEAATRPAQAPVNYLWLDSDSTPKQSGTTRRRQQSEKARWFASREEDDVKPDSIVFNTEVPSEDEESSPRLDSSNSTEEDGNDAATDAFQMPEQDGNDTATDAFRIKRYFREIRKVGSSKRREIRKISYSKMPAIRRMIGSGPKERDPREE